MRITLISTPTRTYTPNVDMPIGIMWLASFLEQHDHEVIIIDGARLREGPKELAIQAMKTDPELIGIGGIITAYKFIIELTKELKTQNPKIPLVLGAQVVINNLQNCFSGQGKGTPS